VRSRIGVRRPAAAERATVPIPDAVDFATQTGTVFFSIDKARKVLGYEPRILSSQGLALVEQWMRHAKYI